MATLPPLPAGFQLDAAPGGAPPPLPPGFQLDPAPGSDTAVPAHDNPDGTHVPLKLVIHADKPAPAAVPPPQPAQGPSVGGSILATANGIADLPIVGPALTKTSDFILSQTLGRLEGKDPSQFMDEAQKTRDATNAANPIANAAGQVAGNVGSFVAGSEVPVLADALGMTGKFGARVANSALSSAGIADADALARGKGGEQALKDTAIGGAAGLASPVIAEGVKAVVAPIAERLQPAFGAVTNASDEASRRVGAAYERDTRAGDRMTNQDIAAARADNVPLVNADLGGETTRALTRSVANQSPEARATIDRLTSDRFAGQGGRAETFVRRIFGGSADDLGYQQRLRTAGEAANRPAYAKAMGAPNAQSVWNADLQQLMQSDKFRAAVKSAESRGSDRAAIEGFQAVKNPFSFNPDGTVTLKANADGSTAVPNLQFWDQVKRNLDGMIESAQRGSRPDRTLVADLTGLKAKLLGNLDAAVPEYKTARSGAAAYFGAEDALQAGKNFAGTPEMLPEARRAFMAMNPADKRAFAIGYASSLIDKIRATSDRTNVITKIFKTPASRQAIEMILGRDKALQTEAYVRVEDLADKLRGALGGSTTVRQLAELGIGAGAGYTFGGHDLKGALGGALLVRGVSHGAAMADAKVMQQVAKILLSDDPNAIEKASRQAAKSPVLLGMVEKLEAMLSAPAHAAAAMVPARQ